MEGLQRGDPASVGGYQLLGRLGAGGMGQVFLGVSPSGRRVAVKLIHPMHAGTEQFRERFAREIEAARRVGGFHTAPVVDADPQADPPWMVTAYIDGPSLQEAVGRYGPLPSARVRALGAGLAEGLAAIHAHGLIHRDLKPGNVIVAEDGPRIIDFGIARAVDSTGLTSTGTVVGTFSYMSPEQVRGDPVMPASDVFSLGCVLGFAATGRPPFGSDTAATVVFRIVSQPPDLAGLADQELGTLIQACLAKSPEDRPAVRAVLTALTGRGPLPAMVPHVPGGPIPAADGRDAYPQTQTPLRVPAGTNSWGEALSPSSTAPPGPAPPGTAPPRTVPPGQPVHARPAGGRPRRRRATLAAAAAAVAALAVVVPVLLTTGSPPAAAGHGPGSGSRATSSATTHGPSGQATTHAPSSGATTPGASSHATGSSPGGTIPARNLTLHAPSLGGIAFSPDGRLLAAGGSKGPLVWDVTTGQLTATLADPGGNQAFAVAFSPDGKLLAAVDGDNNAYLWDVATGTNAATFADPGGGNVGAVAFSPDGTLLAAGEGDRRVVMWDVATRSLTLTQIVASSINAVTFSPDGKFLAAAGTPAFLWDVATGQRYATLYDPGTKYVNDVAFSPDGKILATADVNGNAYLWDVATRTLIATLTPAPRGNSPNQYLDAVAFSPDGTLVAVADSNAHVYLWDVATHALVGNFKDPSGSQVNNVTFGPDGQVLAMSDSNGNLYVRVVSQLIS